MGRPPRIHQIGAFYHATLRGNHRQAIFRDDADRLLLNDIVGDAVDRSGAAIHAYCWMTNHLHLLVQVGEAPLGRLIHATASRYARRYQSSIPTSGHLFERRYHARPIDADAYLLEVIRYIHRNPVRAGITSLPELYPWSSHCAYLGASRPRWLTIDFGLAMLHPDVAKARVAYARFVAEEIDWTPSLIQEAADRNDRRRRDEVKNERLGALVARVCLEANLPEAALESPSKERRLSAVRARIAVEATHSNIATMVEVAQRLRRKPSTITRLLQRYGLRYDLLK